MSVRIFDRSKATRADLDALRAVVARIDARIPATTPHPPPRGPSLGEVYDISVAAADDVLRHSTALDEILRRQDHLDTRLGDVLRSVNRQIAWLANGLEAITARDDDPLAVVDRLATESASAVLEELRAAQVRLATEQARHELALRAEMAQLADRIRDRR